MRRRNVPCSPCSGGSSSCGCCGLKEKLRILWDRTIGSIISINGITPDGDGNFTVQAGNNIDITPVSNGIKVDMENPLTSDVQIDADLVVNGDIIQNGSAYETHAEHIRTNDDYIFMRDNAMAGLPTGDFSGFQVKLYDGVNDGRLVIDRSGTARVGDVGDEQPLLTRDESEDMTPDSLLMWDAVNMKAVSYNGSLASVIKGFVQVGPTPGWNNTGMYTDYPYSLAITINGVTPYDYPIVCFLPINDHNDKLAPFCLTTTNTLTIFASEAPTTPTQLSYIIIQEV